MQEEQYSTKTGVGVHAHEAPMVSLSIPTAVFFRASLPDDYLLKINVYLFLSILDKINFGFI